MKLKSVKLCVVAAALTTALYSLELAASEVHDINKPHVIEKQQVKEHVAKAQTAQSGINAAGQMQTQEMQTQAQTEQAQAQKDQAAGQVQQQTINTMNQGIEQTQQVAEQLRSNASSVASDQESMVSATKK